MSILQGKSEKVIGMLHIPSDLNLQKWLDNNHYKGLQVDSRDLDDDYLLGALLYYANSKYPEATSTDIVSFAGLLQYFCNGWYGGFGTELYKKERKAENICRSIGSDDENLVFEFLEKFYFDSEESGILYLIDKANLSSLILALAENREQYQNLLSAADNFLKKKGNLASLRAAVRIIKKQN